MCNSLKSARQRPLLGLLLLVLTSWLFASTSLAQTIGNKTRAAAHDLAKMDGIGRVATAKEVTAWDIDVRPDFKGLPKGAGTVAQGQDIWEAKCASCDRHPRRPQLFSPCRAPTRPGP